MFMQFLPSLVASAAVYSARICLQLTPVWPLNMISLTKYSIDNLQKCKDMMMRFVSTFLYTITFQLLSNFYSSPHSHFYGFGDRSMSQNIAVRAPDY